MELVCSTCKESKDCSEFSKKSGSKRGYSYKCKACHNEYVKNSWYPDNKEKQIESSANWRNRNYLKYKSNQYNVDHETTVKLFEEADGKCQICKKEEKLCLDHCHTKGHIRGFLCSNCNAALGLFKDDTTILQNAIEYLNG